MTNQDLVNTKIEIEANCKGACADCNVKRKCERVYQRYNLAFYSANDIKSNFALNTINEVEQ